MMLLSFFAPLAYSLLTGTVWSLLFRKKFLCSLAPAYMSHMLLILLSGLFFQRLSVGIYGGIVIFLVSIPFLIYRNKTEYADLGFRKVFRKLWNEGLSIFLILYLFVFVSNSGKRFLDWDEFCHWGMYIKENLRLDNLFCTSGLSFGHKDYVPALSLFETLWCKITGGFSEENAYRSIQFFLISLLLPMLERVNEYADSKFQKDGIISQIKRILYVLSAVLVVLFIPLFFRTNDGFKFYHSIYCDLPVGVVLYWCTFEIYKDHKVDAYHILVLTLGVSVLVLTKMTAMAFLPFLMLFECYKIKYSEKKSWKKYLWVIPTVLIPVLIWAWYNGFVDLFVENDGSTQSYDGMRLSMVADVFLNRSDKIPYLGSVRKSYFEALLKRSIVLPCFSYVVMILLIVFFFLVMGKIVGKKGEKSGERKKLYFSGLWVLCFGIFYALLMFFLYSTAFSQYEATALASYERYMNSFVIAVAFFGVATFFWSDKWKASIRYYYGILVILVVSISLVSGYTFQQVFPGFITNDEKKIQGYTSHSSIIQDSTPEDTSVYIITRGDNGDLVNHLRYYCSPRKVAGASIGPKLYENDVWSRDLSVNEFVAMLDQYESIYFGNVDAAFIKKYAEAFTDPSVIENGRICNISEVLNKSDVSKDPKVIQN